MSSTVSLRDYQSDFIDSLARAMTNNRCVVGQLPTGGGKTRVATAIIQRAIAKGNPVIFICDREELVEQTSEAFDAAGIDHGVIKSDHWRSRPHCPVQIATAQTLSRRRWPHANLVIWDECHTVYKNVLKKMKEWNAVKFIGLTATPLTKGMGKHWDALVIGGTTKSLIDDGYLCPYTVYGPPPPDLSDVPIVRGEYQQSKLSAAVNKKNIIGDIVTTWLSLGENRQTICFAVDVAHSKHIVDEFNSYGIPAAHIDAYTDSDDRKNALNDFASGNIKIISSVDILTKGYDQPQASCLIMARPTKSRTVYIQQAGRVLRIAEGKQNAIILDHSNNTEQHGFPCSPLPTQLCDGVAESRAKQNKKEPKPKSCPKCHYVKAPGVHECPKCAFAPERITEVENTDDRLVRLDAVDTATKHTWYAMLLWISRNKNYNDGWASHAYHDKFHVWPQRKRNVIPMEPNEEVINWVKHMNIKKAKSKRGPQSLPTECKYCNSTNLSRHKGTGSHHAQLRCDDCGRHIVWIRKETA